VPSLYLGTEIGSAGRTLNRPLQKARFTFQALLEFDRGVWMGRLKSIHDFWQGDACIEGARLVSLWRDTCNYNSAHAVFFFHVRPLSFFCDKPKLSLESIVFRFTVVGVELPLAFATQ